MIFRADTSVFPLIPLVLRMEAIRMKEAARSDGRDDATVARADGAAPRHDVEMSQYVAGRSRVNEDKIRQDDEIISQFGEYEYGWHDSDAAGEAAKKGIDENVVRRHLRPTKGEPEWMLDIRLKGYQAFLDKPMPDWGVDLSGFNCRRLQVLRQADRQAGRHLGGSAGRHPEHLRPPGHPRGERRRSVWSPAWPPSTSPRSSTTPSSRS